MLTQAIDGLNIVLLYLPYVWAGGAVVLFVASLGRKWCATLTYALQCVVYDCLVELGRDCRQADQAMNLHHLLARSDDDVDEGAIAAAQEATFGRDYAGFEKRVISRALGAWVADEVDRIRDHNKRNILAGGIMQLLRK